MCAVAALALTACHKDPVQPDGGNQEEQIPTGDGVYNPGMHITGVMYDDGTAPETWVWQDRKLQSINQDDNCGGYTPLNVFSYNGWRMSQMVMYGDLPGTVSYAYSGDKISGFSITSGGMPVATADVVHTGDKITHLDLDVNSEMMQLLLNMIGDMGGLGGLGGFGFKSGDSKVSFTSADVDVDLAWNGDNVSRMVMTADVVLGVTIEEIQQVVPLDSLLGSMASFLSLLGNQELPLTVSIVDTMDYTHDSHPNPLCGLLGRVDASVLSANNVTSMTNHGTMNAVLTITIPVIGNTVNVPYSRPIGEGMTTTYTYNYNAAGYPVEVVGDGRTTTYFYQE